MSDRVPISITTFYRFHPLTPAMVADGQSRLEKVAAETDLRGLVLMGAEGVNATVSGSGSAIIECKRVMQDWLGLHDLTYKDSEGPKHPFNVFKVKVKNEIVSLGRPELVPSAPVNHHLSPEQWQQALHDSETIVLDTRNRYEVEIGKFKTAIDFNLKEFNEFPARLSEANLDKNKNVLIYCTGGIRCEKAILAMHEQGFKNVSQLDGGILNYLKEVPQGEFEGECFVFDYRVAVTPDLEPTQQYKLCPHCGQPARQAITCKQCGRAEFVCNSCQTTGQKTCSKNCAHHAAIGSNSRKPHLPEMNKRHKV